jgi:hypothetical protein
LLRNNAMKAKHNFFCISIFIYYFCKLPAIWFVDQNWLAAISLNKMVVLHMIYVYRVLPLTSM